MLILASNCLTKPQSPVHMNTNKEMYTTHHSTGFLPRVLTRMKRLLVCLHVQHSKTRTRTHSYSGEYQYSVVEAKCVDTQALVFPAVDPRSGVPTESEPTNSSTQNTPTAAIIPTERKAREEGFCIEKVKEQVGCVMNRLDQRCLRGRNRNRNFVKIVADTRSNGELVAASQP